MKQFVAAILLVTLAFCETATARAEQPSAGTPRLSLSPAVVVAHGRFGQSMTDAITLNNGTAQGLGFEMTAEDVVIRNGKRTFVPAGELPQSIASSAIFSQRSGYVAPGSDQTVQVRLTVPDRTSIRAVVIYFKAKNIVATQDLVSFNASLGALITFVLTGDVSLTDSAPHIHPATASQALNVTIELSNAGSEPVVPQGVAAFIDSNGALAAKIPFEQKRLLPGERASFSAEYAGRLKPGVYRVVSTFQFAGKTLTASRSYTVP